MAQKKSRAQLEAELRLIKSARRSDSAVVLGREAFKWGGLCFIAWCASSMVQALAGRNTAASFDLSLLGILDLSVALSWVVGIVGGAYGLQQKKLRKDTVERLQKRIIGLEKKIDPARSSSKLTARGDTRIEDLP